MRLLLSFNFVYKKETHNQNNNKIKTNMQPLTMYVAV